MPPERLPDPGDIIPEWWGDIISEQGRNSGRLRAEIRSPAARERLPGAGFERLEFLEPWSGWSSKARPTRGHGGPGPDVL